MTSFWSKLIENVVVRQWPKTAVKCKLRSLFETSSKLRNGNSKFMMETSKSYFEVSLSNILVFTVFYQHIFEVCKKFHWKLRINFETTSKS